jgi:hemin uptake protein HemP
MSEPADRMNADHRAPDSVSRAARRPATQKPRAVRTSSRALFRGGEVLLIEHSGETYTLRQTRQGKLILTK